MDEEAYKKELAEAGVDLPEVKEEPKAPEEQPQEEPEEPKAPLKEEPKEHKRSIYDEYKDKKAELKSEKELREQAERERDELKQKLDAIAEATGTKEVAAAEKDAIAYAKEVGADPDLVKRIIEDARKGFSPPTDEALRKDLDEFKAWKTTHQSVIEKQRFEEEYQQTLPKLQKLFPNAKDEEMTAIRAELDKMSHTKEWHDKSLGYIAFENQDTLSSLISPKKRGMEAKGRKDAPDTSYEFDPNADYSKMSLKEREQWEKDYEKMMKSEGLNTDAQGRKMIL